MDPKLVLSPETGQLERQWELHFYPYENLLAILHPRLQQLIEGLSVQALISTHLLLIIQVIHARHLSTG